VKIVPSAVILAVLIDGVSVMVTVPNEPVSRDTPHPSSH
jgi:hypothetical protein